MMTPHVHHVDDYTASHENGAGAGQRQQLSAKAWILLHIDDAAFSRAEGERVYDQKSLKLGLDREKALYSVHLILLRSVCRLRQEIARQTKMVNKG